MKKKWFGIVSVLAVMAVLFTGLPAMAQAGTTEDLTVERPGSNTLKIRAPRAAQAGEEVTIGVYKGGTDTPVEGAFVFALSRDSAEVLREEMENLQAEAALTTDDVDSAALADVYDELIDITDENGEVHHTFNETGWYLLIAVKPGYYPGFAPIAIRPVINALDVKAPRIAKVGEEVTIGVYERATGDPVEGALVFAVTPGAAEALREEISTIREDDTDAAEVDYEAVVSAYGELIDITNEDGEVYHAFDKAGRYLLVAVKPNYFPGFARIAVVPAVDALGIKAPDNAPVGEEVTIGVFKRGIGEPVEGAGVWALSRENAATLKDEIAALKEEAENAADIDYEALVSVHGEFIDWTDENGEVQHAFDEAGWYVLVAIKAGFIPGFKAIRIGEIPGALIIKAPKNAPVGKEVTITVDKRGTGEPVEGAGVWALSREDTESLNAELDEIREEGNMAAADIDYEALVSVHGEFLDWTDENGEIQHAFDEAGWYLLVAVKAGYIPGFKPIRIGTVPGVLGIRAPRRAQVGEEVTMVVFERRTQNPVEGAGVWAVSREKIGSLREDIAELKANSEDAVDVDFESLVSLVGEFIDFTDENGKVSHAFDEAGLYFLVALKRGYFPGFAPIKILETNTIAPQAGLQSNGPKLVPQENAVRKQVQASSVLDVYQTD